MLTQKNFVEMVRGILTREENYYAQKLIIGDCEDKKPHRIENWLQVEIYKELKKGKYEGIKIEPSKCDIILDNGCKKDKKKTGLELKVGAFSVEHCHVDQIKRLLNSDELNKAYLLIVYLLGEKIKINKDWFEEFKNRAPIKNLSKDCSSIDINQNYEELISNDQKKALIICCLEVKKE
jgi:hypothetical protein